MRKREPGERKRFPLTFFSIAVLAVLLFYMVSPGSGKKGVLFDKNAPVTLYAKTMQGVMPQIHAADYFPEAGLEDEKFSFDWENCDLDTPGTYLIPVYYEGKETSCVLSLKVQEEGGKLPAATGEGADGSEIYSPPQ